MNVKGLTRGSLPQILRRNLELRPKTALALSASCMGLEVKPVHARRHGHFSWRRRLHHRRALPAQTFVQQLDVGAIWRAGADDEADFIRLGSLLRRLIDAEARYQSFLTRAFQLKPEPGWT